MNYFCSQSESLKASKHTHITLGADCQLDPLQPNHQHNPYEQSRPQTHHLHHNFNHSSSKVDAKGQIIAATLNEACCGDGLPLRSSSPNHSRLSPQHLLDPPEAADDTDPDVIPNQYGKDTHKLKMLLPLVTTFIPLFMTWTKRQLLFFYSYQRKKNTERCRYSIILNKVSISNPGMSNKW